MAATASVFVNAKAAGRQPCDARTQQKRQQQPRSNALTQPHRNPQRRLGNRFKRFAHTPLEKDGHSLRIFFQSNFFRNLKKSLAITRLLCGICRFSLLLRLDKQTHAGVYAYINTYGFCFFFLYSRVVAVAKCLFFSFSPTLSVSYSIMCVCMHVLYHMLVCVVFSSKLLKIVFKKHFNKFMSS